jgi:hypothetical protein
VVKIRMISMDGSWYDSAAVVEDDIFYFP